MRGPKDYDRFFSFSRYLLLPLLVAIILLALGSSLVFFNIGKRSLISSAERHSILVARNLQYELYQHHFMPNGQRLAEFDWNDPVQQATIDTLTQRFLGHLEVVKVNIFDREHRIVYSTDHSLIGQITVNNEKLNAALDGRSVSALELAKDAPDLLHDVHQSDLLETYIPLRHMISLEREGEIDGAFEIYQDVTGMYARVSSLRSVVFAAAFGLMGLFFVFLLLVARRADGLQAALQAEVRSHSVNLEAEVATRTDQLARKTAYLQAILNNVPSAFILLDKNLVIRTASARLEDLTNVDAELAIGRSCSEVFDCSGASGCPALEVVESGRAASTVMQFDTPDGGARLMEHTAVPVMEGGRLDGVLEIVTDVTERKRMEDRVVQTERLSATGELAAVVAHEFRNGLTSLKLILQFLRKSDRIREDESRSLGIALDSISEMETVVSRLLSYARPQPPDFKVYDINRVVKDSVEFVGPRANARGVRIDVDLDLSIGSIALDREHLKSAFVNILLNAIEASQKGDDLAVSTRVIEWQPHPRGRGDFETGDKMIRVRVQDSGEGIADEDVPHVFEPFFTTKTTGTGLGLPTAERTINEHRGVVLVDSRPGLGTTFDLIVPCEEKS